MASASRFKEVFGSPATALSSGITIGTSGQPLVRKVEEYRRGPWCRTKIYCNAFTFEVAGAALSVGQKLYDFPEGFIMPISGKIYMTSTCAAGVSATAGEVGLGTVIGSGANATLTAVATTTENIMNGTTLSNHVASTLLTSNKANQAGQLGVDDLETALAVIDGTSTAADCFFNIASTWAGTGTVTINNLVAQFDWWFLGDNGE